MNYAMVCLIDVIQSSSLRGWDRSGDCRRYSALKWGLVLLGPCFHMLVLKIP
jgi:hypothetical protein